MTVTDYSVSTFRYARFRDLGFTPEQAFALSDAGYSVWLVPYDALLAATEPAPLVDRGAS